MAFVPASMTAIVRALDVSSSSSNWDAISAIRPWTKERSSRRLPMVRVMVPLSSCVGVGSAAPMRATVSELRTPSPTECPAWSLFRRLPDSPPGASSQHLERDERDVVGLFGALGETREVLGDRVQELPGAQVAREAPGEPKQPLLSVVLHQAV